MNVYPYVVHLRYTKADKVEDHVVHTSAYTLQDAVMQAAMELDAQHDFTAKGYTSKIISLGPDIEKVQSAIDETLAHVREGQERTDMFRPLQNKRRN